MTDRDVVVDINGEEFSSQVEPRMLLSDFLRHRVGLTGTHVGCEHGVCGACTVLVDDTPQRSCLVFAVQADQTSIQTIEGVAAADEPLSVVQRAFKDAHGLQCGFCTPGFVMSVSALLKANPHPSESQIADTLSGHLCRCTGYRNIFDAVRLAVRYLGEETGS